MLNDYNRLKQQIFTNQNSSSLLQFPNQSHIKKFNTKGYYHQIQPYYDQYLKKKHQTYIKYHNKQNKQNYVYNLSNHKIPIGYYRIKGCNPINTQNHNNIKEKRKSNQSIHQSKLINSKSNHQEHFSTEQDKSEKIITGLYQKYIQRKQRLLQKSQKGRIAVFSTCNISAINSRLYSRASEQSTQLFRQPKTNINLINLPKRTRDFPNVQRLPLKSQILRKQLSQLPIKTQNSRQQINQTIHLPICLSKQIPKSKTSNQKNRRRLKTSQ